jgi:hypothetical protein
MASHREKRTTKRVGDAEKNKNKEKKNLDGYLIGTEQEKSTKYSQIISA